MAVPTVNMYYVNIKGQYFRLVDVPGDGDCFYHSVLRNTNLAKRFSNVNSLRQYVTDMVSLWFENDGVLRSLFLFEGKDYKHWAKRTANNGTWASTFDMLVLSYVLKVNIVSVGNYLEGFACNDMRVYFMTQNPHLPSSLKECIPKDPVIHIYFHLFGNPLEKTSNGNHFGYLEPIPTTSFVVQPNTIKAVSGKAVGTNGYCEATTNKKRSIQSILTGWNIATNQKAKMKINSLIDIDSSERKSLGAKEKKTYGSRQTVQLRWVKYTY